MTVDFEYELNLLQLQNLYHETEFNSPEDGNIINATSNKSPKKYYLPLADDHLINYYDESNPLKHKRYFYCLIFSPRTIKDIQKEFAK